MRWVCLAVAAVLGAPAATAAKDIQRDYHESFDVKEGARLELRHGDGDVEISVWDRDVVDVEVHYRAKVTKVGVGTEPDFRVDFEQKGDLIRVTGHEKAMAVVGFLSRSEDLYVYTIRAPAYLAVSTRGEDGDVAIAGLRDRVDIRLGDGDVHLTDVDSPAIAVDLEDGDLDARGIAGRLEVDAEDGDVRLRDAAVSRGRIGLSDGDLTAEHCSGPFQIRAQDGDVTLRAHRAGSLTVRTDDGSARIALVPGDVPDVDIESGDGDVTLELAAGVSAAFLLATDDGRIVVDAPGARRLEHDHDRAYGEIGDAEGEIRIRADDGSVTLRAEKGGA
jgi:hypothetical protein